MFYSENNRALNLSLLTILCQTCGGFCDMKPKRPPPTCEIGGATGAYETRAAARRQRSRR
jgi:hypothetical protein